MWSKRKTRNMGTWRGTQCKRKAKKKHDINCRDDIRRNKHRSSFYNQANTPKRRKIPRLLITTFRWILFVSVYQKGNRNGRNDRNISFCLKASTIILALKVEWEAREQSHTIQFNNSKKKTKCIASHTIETNWIDNGCRFAINFRNCCHFRTRNEWQHFFSTHFVVYCSAFFSGWTP